MNAKKEGKSPLKNNPFLLERSVHLISKSAPYMRYLLMSDLISLSCIDMICHDLKNDIYEDNFHMVIKKEND